MLKSSLFFIPLLFILWLGSSLSDSATDASKLTAMQDEQTGSITIVRSDTKAVLLIQNAGEDFRPYIHPIAAPDGKGVLTEMGPDHHKYQTGLYWGLSNVNGRDYFSNPGKGYWKRVAVRILEKEGEMVKWQTVYDLLDEKGGTVMTETQDWSMEQREGRFLLSLDWKGEAKTDVTVGKHPYGGLFLRMPWKPGMDADVVNAARQHNDKAEGQSSIWIDLGMQVDGRTDRAHIAILDHPDNKGYPQKWSVDQQMGVGPVRGRDADWPIKSGETETVKHQLVIYTGTFSDISITNAWARFAGKDPSWATVDMWALAKKEGMDAKFLSPEDAVKAMTLKKGFQANVFAAEPMITQPMAFCWDDKGRLWVAENRDYESRSGGFSNDGNSRILILEDTDHDGKADTRKVFADGIPFPAAMAVGFDGVFVGAPPNLLFIPDRNHDDRADLKDIEVRLTGWGIRDRHETMNSFHWGPDGWLYGCQGFATPSRIRKPLGKGKLYRHKEPFPEDEILKGEGTDINGGVWRYHPLKDKFEVVAHGFSNPWGIDYDAMGQIFITACVIPHLWYVIPGGIYHRQGGQHFNPYTYTDIKTIADHSHRSAHGGASIYQSDAFPADQQGRIFMANIHEHAILTDILKPEGSGFRGSHGDDLMAANNAQWVGFSTSVGPDGDLYVLDWHDADICGGSVLNKETGRIFRISPVTSQAENFRERYEDLNKLSDRKLVELQSSKSDWHARRARLILQHRAFKGQLKKGTLTLLRNLFSSKTTVSCRLKAMWTLYICEGWTTGELTSLLDDPEAYVRAWAIQFLSQDTAPSREVLNKFEQMALKEVSPVVRLYLASAIQRIAPDKRWTLTAGLLSHQEDENDHNLPKILWYGLEPLVKKEPQRALDLAATGKWAMIRKFVARRITDADQTDALVSWMSRKNQVDTAFVSGMRDGLEGRTDLKTPGQWKLVYQKLQHQGERNKMLALEIAQYFGDTEAAARYFSVLRDKSAASPERRKALQALSAQQRLTLLEDLPALLDDKDLRNDAIRAIASYDDEKIASLLLQKYTEFNETDKAAAIETLASRPRSGWMLAQAIRNKTIEKRDVPASVARQLRRVVGSGFVEIWGPIDQLPSNELAYKKYRALLSPEALGQADLKKGQLLFMRTCGSCHKMYGEGGSIGPNLTGSNRSKVDYLLFNVLDPSAEIQDDYKLVVITTRDGRTYSGNVASENERQISLRIVGQDLVLLNKSNIQSRETMPVSMMPNGLFETLTDNEVVDLVGFLSRSK